MKKDKVKSNKNVLLIAGIAASIVMIVIVLSFSVGVIAKNVSIDNSRSITGNSINLKEIDSSSEYPIKQEISTLLEKKCKEINNNKSIFNEALIIELPRNGNKYLCINAK